MTWRTLLATGFMVSLVAGFAAGRLPGLLPCGYALISSLSIVLYRHDKRAAQGGRPRTRERTLHLVDLLGGWPGGLVAQGHFRHKTRKTSFQVWFWLTAALNCAAVVWLSTIRG